MKNRTTQLLLVLTLLTTLVSCSEVYRFINYRNTGTNRTVNDDYIKKQPIEKPERVSVDKEDGFYATVDYIEYTTEKDIKLEDKPTLTTKDILEVQKGINSYNNEPEITIKFTKEGAEKFYLLTKDNIGKPIVIVIGQQIISMPIVSSEIKGGQVSISGSFTMEEINDMVELLTNK